MHIVVDGYNLIRQSSEFRQYERRGLEEGRRYLIKRLSAFKKKKRHAVTVVFDGWDNGPIDEERTKEGAITIIFSRRGEKADDVIKRMAYRNGKALLIVTSDRDLAYAASRSGATVVSSNHFEDTINQIDYDSGLNKSNGDEIETTAGSKKKGPSRRLPKNKRSALNKIRHL
jgi:uncharacterized protein